MSKMRFLLLGLICLLLSGFSTACVPPTPPECRAFLNLPREQRHAEFRTYEIEKQLDVYLCTSKSELPDVGLADEVANRGEVAMGPIIAKLESVQSEADKYEMIHLLEVMSERGYLRGKKEVIAQISDVIDEMKLDPIKQRSVASLKKIQLNSGLKPFTYVH
jgi:hypothetical protein